MKTMKVVTTACLLILSIAAALPTAALTTPTQTVSFSEVPNKDVLCTFDKFDMSGYNLTGVTIGLDLGISGGRLGVDNDSTDPAGADLILDLGAAGDLSSTDVILWKAPLQPIFAALNISTGVALHLDADNGDGIGNVDLTAPDGYEWLGQPESDSASGNVSSLYFSGYIGAGTFDITAALTQIMNYGQVSGIEMQCTPVSASGNVNVTYEYEPVPEPSGIVALLTGVGGLLGMGFRRRR